MSKLFITDKGDVSVGMFPRTWTVEHPFTKDEADKEFLEWFRLHMIGIYSEFSEGNVIAEYDFELAKESEYER